MHGVSSDVRFAPPDTAAEPVEEGPPALPLSALLRSPELPSERVLVPGLPRDRGLSARAWHVVARTAGSDLPVRYLGCMPIFKGHRVYQAPERDWALLNLADDPLLGDRDGFPIAKRILETLERVRRRIDFDTLFVAHEVPRGAVVEGRPLPAEVVIPPPSKAGRELPDGLGQAGQALWMVAASPLVGAGLLAALLAGGVALLGGVALDPVLLGVVVGPGRPLAPGEPAAWFYLSHWAYDEA